MVPQEGVRMGGGQARATHTEFPSREDAPSHRPTILIRGDVIPLTDDWPLCPRGWPLTSLASPPALPSPLTRPGP